MSQGRNLPHNPNTSRINTSFNNNLDILNNNQNCFNTNKITLTDARSGVLAWLSPLEPRSRQFSLAADRVEGVGDWLLQTEQFQTWHSLDTQSEPQNATLFCHGNPGVGKTYIW